VLGELSGAESVTLTAVQLPAHSHAMAETPAAAGNAPVPTNRVPAATAGTELTYGSPALAPGAMAATAVSAAGTVAPLPHENRQPHLAIFYCIATEGVFPSQ
jgi:microcystin-dependent protein